MTPRAQRIAIAEACGWKQGISWWMSPSGKSRADLPDYLNDLNACHEFEKMLNETECERYEAFLNDPANIPDGNTPPADYVFHSTAAQRAEAFLKTKGLWTE